MGLSWDNWHKHCVTEGKRKPHPKKGPTYAVGRPAASTKIDPRRIRTVLVRGANSKYWAWRLDVGNLSWGSECCTRQTSVIDGVYNASNDELVHTKILVKNCVVVIGSGESQYALPLGHKKQAKLTPEEEDILNEKWSRKIQKKLWKEKERPNQQSSRGAVPGGQAFCVHRFKARPVCPEQVAVC